MLQSSLTLQHCVGVSCRSMPPSPGWQWDTIRLCQEGCQGCVTGRHIPTVSGAQTPPKFPTPNSPSPGAAIQVGYRAGTASSPPPCRVLGVSCWRGPKPSQTLCQEPQTLVTSLILGRGLAGGPQLLRGDTPPILASWGHTGTNPVALLLLESRAGAVGVFGVPLGRSAPPSCSAGCCSSQGSACVLPSPGDTAAPRSPAGGSPHLPGHTTPESQDGGPVPRAARTPPPAPAAP